MSVCFNSHKNVISWVPFYCSDSEGEKKENKIKKKTSTKNIQSKSWRLKLKFRSRDRAKLFLQKEKVWSCIKLKKTKKGEKKYYRCNLVKSKGPKCSAEMYLLYVAFSDEVQLFRTEADHDHDTKLLANYGLSDRVKEEIDKFHQLKMNPRAIQREIAKVKGIVSVPKLTQIRTYIYNKYRLKREESPLLLGQLEGCLSSHSYIPTEEHETYVISYEISEDGSFRFVLSTKNLLHKATNAKMIHADRTSSLVWRGYPVLVVGTSDANQTFHPLAVAVASDIEKEDFQFMFFALRNAISTLSDGQLKYQPDVLVCDGSEPLKKAFKAVFGETAIVKMCWAHAKRKMRENIEQLVKKENRKQLRNDLDFLHSVTSPELFDLACDYFKAKWEAEPLFLNYFEEQWLTENREWYLGVHRGSPATNSALESFNVMILDEQKIREQLPVSAFLRIAYDMVHDWSLAGNTLALVPTISQETWKAAYQWAKKVQHFCEYDLDDEYNLFVVPSSPRVQIRTESVECDTLEEVKEQFYREWEVSLPILKDWTHGFCNCPEFFKYYICKHLVGMALKCDLSDLPPELEDQGSSKAPKFNVASPKVMFGGQKKRQRYKMVLIKK